MPLNFENELDLLCAENGFFDLRGKQDDKTVLKNPHKGWYYHYVDNGAKASPSYRKGLEEARPFKITGINHLYMRLDWSDIEGDGEGKFDWSFVDKTMDEWGALGYKFSFRFCTFEGAGYRYSTPKWVFDLGAEYNEIKVVRADGKELIGYEPKYDDEIYLEKLCAFLSECGKKLDGDPRVEYVDVGCFGTWGEGHTSSGSDTIYHASVLKKYVDMHLKYFPNTTVVMNDDFIHHTYKLSPDSASEIYDYARNKGVGLRDDSVCVDGYIKQFGYNTLRHPTIFKGFAENAPVDIECCHIWHNIPERYKDGLPIIEALRTAHASYAGFHGYEDDWLAKSEYFSDYITNRLGYWFFIDAIHVGTPTSGTSEMLKLYVSNRGFSKCYHKYELRFRLRDGEGKVYPLDGESPDPRRWAAESSATESLRLSYKNVPAGKYRMEAGLFEGDTAIKLGMAAELSSPDGYYSLAEFSVSPMAV